MSVIKNKRTKMKVSNSMQPLDFSDTASSADLKRVNRLLAGSQSQSTFPTLSWGNVVNNIDYNKVDARSLYEIVASSEFYSSESTYEVGDIVVVAPDYSDVIPAGLWKCTVAISTPEEFNSDHWESVNLIELIADVGSSGPTVYDFESAEGESIPYWDINNPLESNVSYLMCLHKYNSNHGAESVGLYMVHVPTLTSSMVYLSSSDYASISLLGSNQFTDFLISETTLRLRAPGAPSYGYSAVFIKLL